MAAMGDNWGFDMVPPVIRRAYPGSSATMSQEDAALLEAWLAGPGAAPTAADKKKRWLKATRDGRLPRRRLAAG